MPPEAFIVFLCQAVGRRALSRKPIAAHRWACRCQTDREPVVVSRQRVRPHPCLVVCPPGLEEAVAEELKVLGGRLGRRERGAVSVELTTRQLYASNLYLRTATRVLVRIGGFTVRSFADLERRIAAIDWNPWIAPGVVPRFRVTTHNSKLWHDGAVAERFMNALGPSSDATVTEHGPTQLFVVRGVDDRFVISVDASGAPLHERGWRQALAKAPLRESVAAGLLSSAGWDPTTPLLDPMCGSGTIAIEAALLVAGVPAATSRDLALRSWPCFEPGTWASVAEDANRTQSEAKIARTSDERQIVASDRDAGAVEAARANAERAGVAELIEFRVAPVAALEKSETNTFGLVATNPPWGRRVGDGDLRNLYATLGRVAAERCAGWGIGVLVADRALARQVRPGLTERLHLEVGGRTVHWLTGPLG